MKVKLRLLPEEGLHLEGEDPPSILDCPGEFYRFEQPVRYALDLMETAPNRILARGRLSTVVRARCVRTLEWFDLPVEVEDFVGETETRRDEVDLTPLMREDILLALPSHPAAPGTQPLAAQPPGAGGPGSGRWNKLDQLNIAIKEPGAPPRPKKNGRFRVPPRS
ncbi:MAG: hypothetical protein IT578_01360 [Verrucomicrobiae bacterium]|nr:hypothetical protein [Verrucomicrobiae bacterium]